MVPDGPGPRVKRKNKKNVLFTALANIKHKEKEEKNKGLNLSSRAVYVRWDPYTHSPFECLRP